MVPCHSDYIHGTLGRKEVRRGALFPLLVEWGVPPPLAKNLLIPSYETPPSTKFLSVFFFFFFFLLLAVVIAPVPFSYFILFVHTGQANFDFNQCSIFTKLHV